jgi:hypothetical protein
MPPDFILRLEWRRTREDDNSGVFVRFPHPDSKGYDNTAWVAVHFGFEVQIDELGRPDGAGMHKTGAIYDEPFQGLTLKAARPVGEWNDFEIRVQGQTYTVQMNGQQVTTFTYTAGSDPQRPDRGLPSTTGVPRYVGLQAHTGQVAFRNIRYQAIGAPLAPARRAASAAGQTTEDVKVVRDSLTLDAVEERERLSAGKDNRKKTTRAAGR